MRKYDRYELILEPTLFDYIVVHFRALTTVTAEKRVVRECKKYCCQRLNARLYERD